MASLDTELKEFRTWSVRCSPFSVSGSNKIIYLTDFDYNRENGIFEYNIDDDKSKLLCPWIDDDVDRTKYGPEWFTAIYSETKHIIICVGGRNLRNNFSLCKGTTYYDLNDNKLKDFNLNLSYGRGASMLLTNNDTLLHIIGGEENDDHIIYNLSTKQLCTMYSFQKTNPGLHGNGLLFHKSKHKMICFGGSSWRTYNLTYDDYWEINLSDPKLTLLSMDDKKRSKYLVSAYVNGIWANDKMKELSLNEIILQYLGDGAKYKVWYKNEEKTMIKPIRSFGYILYDDRIIITFGGKSVGGRPIDDIYYIDLESNQESGWRESTIKCPKPGCCHAVLINHRTIHILPYFDYKEHWTFNLSDLLPANLL